VFAIQIIPLQLVHEGLGHHERVPYVPWVIDEPDEDDRPIMYGLIRMACNEGMEWPPRGDKEF
jgi:hypothetical protein